MRPVEKFTPVFHVLKVPYDPVSSTVGISDGAAVASDMLPPKAQSPLVDVPIPR